MLGSNFYHGIIPKCVTLFGNIFNDIKINRFSEDGKSKQVISVPILYGPKDKYITLLSRDPNNPKVQIQLPRMSFAITNIQQDEARKVNPINKNVKMVDGNYIRTSFAEVPINIDFELSIYTKSYVDSTQIVEQIVPFFTPDFNANVKLIPDMTLDFDIKTKLTGISFTNEFEGAVENTRVINWVLNFTMETFLLGPINKEGLIKKAIVNLVEGDVEKSGSISQITVTPGLTFDGKPTSNIEETIDYRKIQPDDNYGFITEKDVFFSKAEQSKQVARTYPSEEELKEAFENMEKEW